MFKFVFFFVTNVNSIFFAKIKKKLESSYNTQKLRKNRDKGIGHTAKLSKPG